jgi:sugar (pentulose or hexulose) kinase
VILSLDVGTSSVRAAVHDAAGRIAEGRFRQEVCEPRATPDGGAKHDAGRLPEAAGRLVDAVLGGPKAPEMDPHHGVVASGGAAASSRAWIRMIAGAMGRRGEQLRSGEAAARGAALFAAEALGLLPDLAASGRPPAETFEPDAGRHARPEEASRRQERLYGAL